MEINDNNLNQNTRTYFLEQGKSIAKLYEILNTNILVHHIRKWTGVLLEIMFYFLFALTIMFIFLFPVMLEFQLNESPGVSVELKIDEIAGIIFIIKIVLALLSLPLLFFGILLGRNRKRNNLIREAFVEVKKMKTDFDIAVKELSL